MRNWGIPSISCATAPPHSFPPISPLRPNQTNTVNFGQRRRLGRHTRRSGNSSARSRKARAQTGAEEAFCGSIYRLQTVFESRQPPYWPSHRSRSWHSIASSKLTVTLSTSAVCPLCDQVPSMTKSTSSIPERCLLDYSWVR
ncbi:hypothetical protein GQ607_002984 [Colletotrichum asianum]|uniref:Uncharacterized protein n=1 Tax=Colletotrichum asianum TaxID=702518 RepID=A0A8H3WPV6_9PEZI|nr:hypothetical protein GQ607_002984 [Colletotrichum asianum]